MSNTTASARLVFTSLSRTYRFTEAELIAFIEQVCAEQREGCVKAVEDELWARYRAVNTELSDRVLNAPTPHVIDPTTPLGPCL